MGKAIKISEEAYEALKELRDILQRETGFKLSLSDVASEAILHRLKQKRK